MNRFTAEDVAAILRARGWLGAAIPSRAEAPGNDKTDSARLKPCPDGSDSLEEEMKVWLEEAAALLGPHAADRKALGDLLDLVFHYDAQEVLGQSDTHAVLAREGARDVIRELAHLVLEGQGIDSDRFKELVDALKQKLPARGRELFHPIRLALAGRAGDGGLDRVILLLDRAANLPFLVQAKSARQRILEFCAALD